MEDTQKKMILDWMRKIHQLEYAHRYESLYWSNKSEILGISAFFITTIIASSYVFPPIGLKLYNCLPFFFEQSFFIPIASAIVAVITGLQTFQKPSEKSEIHKKTGSNYEKLRHRIEIILTTDYSKKELKKKLENIKEEWESLDSINVSKEYFDEGKIKVTSFNKYPKELDFLDDIN